jgi:diguanylate cyclase (GGDEF)-like protein/PAS domain S-box-containing protein
MGATAGSMRESEAGALNAPSARVRQAAELVRDAPLPMLLVWGELRQHLLNDACVALGLGESRHDDSGEAWDQLLALAADQIEACFGGAAVALYDQPLAVVPSGRAIWCDLYFIPVHDDGQVVAALCTLVDTTERVLAQQRLAQLQDEARHRAAAFSIVYSNMEEVAFHVRRDDAGAFHFESVNNAFCAATGLTRGQVVGKRIEQVIPEPSCTVVREHYRAAIARGATERWEETTAFPSGLKVGLVSVTPVFDAHGELTNLVGTVHDITAVKRVEARLRAANAELERQADSLRVTTERLDYALESAGEGVWDWDLLRQTVFYSKRWKAILGLPPDLAAEADLWWKRMHPDDVESARACLATCLRGAEPTCEHRHRLWHEAGRWIWIEARGSVVARDGAGRATRMVGAIVDATATTELRQELERSYDLLAKLAQQVPGALFQLVQAPSGQVSCPFVSATSQELFELTPEEIESNLRRVLHRIFWRDRALVREAMRASASALQPWRTEFRVKLADGRVHWRELSAKPARLGDGAVVWHGIISDIGERKRTEETIRQFNETIERRAHYDGLTGLPNRELFRDRLEQEMKRAASSQRGMALLFIDLDRFKEVNDLLGHGAGDALLVHAARRIGRCLQPGDTVARLGGDEFTVILTGTAEVGQVEQSAQQIVEVLRAPFRIGIEQVNVSASVGITLYPGDGDQPEQLMRNADHAMYRAKGAGRNRLAFFEPTMQAAAMRRLKLTNALRRALPDDQLLLYFQPIVDIRSGQVCKGEALLRWRRPGCEQLALPSEFVGIAEDTGLIHDIGNWVFFQAARCAQHWSSLTRRRFQVSINKSPVQFQRHAHAVDWIEHLERQGMAHNSIAVEITEGLLLNLTDSVFARLHQLQAGGIEVSIDDFGTGYSSMSYLKRLDIDYLKIDQSFVSEMLTDRSSQTITETIIVMAHKLGLKVIAEGVESAAQRDWLCERGCDYLQGYLFGRPMDAHDFERLLVSQPFAQAARAQLH